MAGARLVGAVHAVAIDGAGTGVGQVAVPHLVGELGQFDALHFPVAEMVEQAELHLCRVGRKQGEIHAAPVPGRPERKRSTFPYAALPD